MMQHVPLLSADRAFVREVSRHVMGRKRWTCNGPMTRRPASCSLEQLEPKLMMTVIDPADPESFQLSQTQAFALLQGLQSLTDRLDTAGTMGLLSKEVALLGQPLGTLVSVGSELRDRVIDKASALLGATPTVGQVIGAFESLTSIGHGISIFAIAPRVEYSPDLSQTLWFDLELGLERTFAGYSLDFSQEPGIAGSLADRGLVVGEAKVDLKAGIEGKVSFGIDTSKTADDSFVLAFDCIEVYASAIAQGVTAVELAQASFGVVDLGPTKADVLIEARACVDLIEIADGRITGSQLSAIPDLDLFDIHFSTGTLDIDIPFELAIGGFDQSGSNISLGLGALDLFDPGSITLDLPSLTLPGIGGGPSQPFDFSSIAFVGPGQLFSALEQLSIALPDFGSGIELPFIDLDFGKAFDLTSPFKNLLLDIKLPSGEWAFTTIDGLLELVSKSTGVSIDDLGFDIRPDAQALEFGLSWSWDEQIAHALALGQLLPSQLPMELSGSGAVMFEAKVQAGVTVGVLLTNPTLDPSQKIDSTALLSSLNAGSGLTQKLTVQGDDLTFQLRDGSTVGLDIDALALGDGTQPGAATIADLIQLVTTKLAGKVVMTLQDNRLIIEDQTVGNADFSVRSGSEEFISGSGDSQVIITKLSGAPIALGLIGKALTGEAVIKGTDLAGRSLLDRIYFHAGSIFDAEMKLEAGLEAGASVGPVGLSIDEGKITGAAKLDIQLIDPGTGTDADGLIFLSELRAGINAGTSLVQASPVNATIDGVLPVRLRPDSLNAAFDINPADYSFSPLDGVKVPFIQITGDWNTGSVGFSAEPSEKLRNLFAGLADFSRDDLREMVVSLVDYLKGLSFMDAKLPVVDLTLADILGIIDSLEASLATLDIDLAQINLLIGLPSIDGAPSTGLWQALDLIDTELNGWTGDLGLLGVLRGHQARFRGLLTQWENRDPGLVDFEVGFLNRLRALSIETADLLLAFDGVLSPNLKLQLGKIPLALGQLDVGLEGFALRIQNAIPAHFNPVVSIRLDTSIPNASKLVFDFKLGLVDYKTSYDLKGLSFNDNTPLDLTGSGVLAFEFDGFVQTQFGWDLSKQSAFIDLDKTSVNLAGLIDDAGGLVLEASLGGLAGISVGSNEPGKNKARISLTDSTGNAPATFIATGAGNVTSDALFKADLPLYIDTLGTLSLLGTGLASASIKLGSDPAFGLKLDFVPGEFDSLSDVFGSFNADFSTWATGGRQLIAAIKAALSTEILGQLPYLSDIDLSSDGFLGRLDSFFIGIEGIDTPAELAGVLNTRLSEALPDGVTGKFEFFYFSETGSKIAVLESDGTEFNDLLGASDSFIVQLSLAGTSVSKIDAGQLDLGVEAINLKIKGDASVDFVRDYAVSLGLGFSRQLGFFLATGTGNEVSVSAGVGFAPDAELRADLGVLSFAISDATPGSIIPVDSTQEAREKAIASRELHAELGIDLIDPSGDNKFTLAELSAVFTGAKVTGEFFAKLDVDLTASIFGKSGPGLGVNLDTGWYAADGSAITIDFTGGQGGLALPDIDFHFNLGDAFIDLGGLISGPLFGLVDTINKVLEPIRPILDMLTSELPLVSELSQALGNGPVTFLDAISWFGDGFDSAVKVIETAALVASIAEGIKPAGDSLRFSLGSLSAVDASKLLKSAGIDQSAFSYGAGTTSNGSVATFEDAKSSQESGGFLTTLDELGVSFPILSDPGSQLFNLLVGRDADLVYWDVPDLEQVGFDFEQSYPLFPPLFVGLNGAVEFTTNFDIGYDTRGIRQALALDRPSKAINGLYLDDHVTGSTDAVEAALAARIGATADLEVLVAKAGVEGGVRAEIGANLADPDDNGKVHFDEFLENARKSLACVFDFEGSLSAYLAAYIKLGFSTPFGFVTLFSDRFKLADVTLLSFENQSCPPLDPQLATVMDVDHDLDQATPVVRALVLNSGARAGMVLPGMTDGDDEFVVDQVDGQIVVSAFDFEQTFNPSEFGMVWFDAGEGNDIITVNPSINLPVWGYGGNGNDRLTGGAGVNVLYGDFIAPNQLGGDDTIKGRGADDTLHGGGGDDAIYGYGGNDKIYGGGGNDQLFGDDAIGDMVEFNSKNPEFKGGTPGDDFIDGGAGDDQIYAGFGDDTLHGFTGDDQIFGSAGNDLIEGHEGNDQLYGGDGHDKIYGDDIDGKITNGSASINADLIEAGAGSDWVSGGAGDDIVYGHDEALGLDGPDQRIIGNLYAETIFAGSGNDTVYGARGNDYVDGGTGNDLIMGGDGDDLLYGNHNSDAILAGLGNDRVFGGHGNDVIDGGQGDDHIEGGEGDDKIYAREGADIVYGGHGFEGYQRRNYELSLAPIVQEIFGGFTATPSDDDCGFELFFVPPVYPEATKVFSGLIYDDTNANGMRDLGEPDSAVSQIWTVSVVSNTTGQMVWSAQQSGGIFQIPGVDGLPADIYTITVSDIPFGWVPNGVSSVVQTVDVRTKDMAQTLEFGFYRNATLEGTVELLNPDTQTAEPISQVTVFIDVDGDGVRDANEPHSPTDNFGNYSFFGLRPGEYKIVVEPPPGCYQVLPGSIPVLLSSGQEAKEIDFLIAEPVAPVVKSVALAELVEERSFVYEIPAGSAQYDPIIPVVAAQEILVRLCGPDVKTTLGSARLFLLSEIGKEEILMEIDIDAIPNPNDLETLVFRPKNPLQPGVYQLLLEASSVQDSQGDQLDGEWVQAGSNYPSGDGNPGGDFKFNFVIGGVGEQGKFAMANSATGPGDEPKDVRGNVEISGNVWLAPSEFATNADRPLGAAPIDGIVIDLFDGQGGLIDSTTTSTYDVNGDGRIAENETGYFAFNGLPTGEYYVSQRQQGAWRQVTPGGKTGDPTLYAVVGAGSPDAGFYVIFEDGNFTFKQNTLPNLDPRDVAIIDSTSAYIVGTPKASGGNTLPGTQGLFRLDRESNQVLDLGPTPFVVIGLESIGDGKLAALTSDGGFTIYSTQTDTWSEQTPVRDTKDDTLFYPAGDLAFNPVSGTYYAVAFTSQPGPANPRPGAQHLVEFAVDQDGNVQVLRVQVIDVNDLLVGLEDDRSGTLVALGSSGQLYRLSKETGQVVEVREVEGFQNFSFGGLALQRGELQLDYYGRGGFTLTVDPDDKVPIGFGNTSDLIYLIDGNDYIDGGCGEEADTLYGDDDNFLGQNIVSIGGRDYIRGRGGNDTLVGGQQDDRLEGDEGDDSLSGNDGNDILVGGDDNDSIYGGNGNDQLFGSDGNDTMLGGDGHDTFWGGLGDDTMAGDAGNDTFHGDAGSNTINAGTGTDTFIETGDYNQTITNVFHTGIGTNTLNSIERGILTGGAGNNEHDGTQFSGYLELHGLAGNDTLRGGKGTTLIIGGFGDDVLRGGTGNDTFFFVDNFDLDTAFESGGNDTFDFSNLNDDLRVEITSGPAKMQVSSIWGPHSVVINADAIETLKLGTGSDTVYIGDASNTVTSIDGGEGTNALLYSGLGLTVPVWTTSVVVNLAAGTATGLTGIKRFQEVHGGAGDDILIGDDSDNYLSGHDGNDKLLGADGNDILIGGDGDDLLDGMLGNDSLYGQGGNDTLVPSLGNNILYFFDGFGKDAYSTGLGNNTFDFSGMTKSLMVVIADKFTADDGTNAVSASSTLGVYSVIGSSNADRFVLGNGKSVSGFLSGGSIPGLGFEHLDTLDYSAWTNPVTLSYLGINNANQAGTATGVALGVVNFRHVIGGSGNDKLTGGGLPVWFEGGAGNDTIIGSMQTDRIDGGTGNDQLAGGFGDDEFRFENGFGTDTIVEDLNAGLNTLDFSKVTVGLNIDLGANGKVDVTQAGNAAHAAGNIYRVIAGTANDQFRMTGPDSAFPGIIDGGLGFNTLLYDFVDPVVAGQIKLGQTPAVGQTLNIQTVMSKDIAAPTASLLSPIGQVVGVNDAVEFTVVFEDDVAVSVAGLGIGSEVVKFVGPHGFTAYAQIVAIDSNTDTSPLFVTFRIDAPVDGWKGVHNGQYNLSVDAGSVTDTSGNGVPLIALGSFTVSVPVGLLVGFGAAARHLQFIDADGTTVDLLFSDSVGQVRMEGENLAEHFDGFVTRITGGNLRLSQIEILQAGPGAGLRVLTSGGDGQTQIGQITGNVGLRSIVGPGVMLMGDGLSLNSLGHLRIAGLAGSASIVVTNNADRTSLILGSTAASSLIDIAGTVRSAIITGNFAGELRAESIGSFRGQVVTGTLQADGSIGQINVAGFSAGMVEATSVGVLRVRGDMEANLNVGEGVRLVLVDGGITTGNWTVKGNVNTIAAGRILAGWTGQFVGDIQRVVVSGSAALNVNVESLGSLRVGTTLSGQVSATSIGWLQALRINAAEIDVTGPGEFPGQMTLRSVSVANAVTGSSIRVAGNVGMIGAGSFAASVVHVGVMNDHTGLVTTRAQFTDQQSRLGNFKVAGAGADEPSYVDTVLSAYQIGKVSLRQVKETVGAESAVSAVKIGKYTRDGGGRNPLRLVNLAKGEDQVNDLGVFDKVGGYVGLIVID